MFVLKLFQLFLSSDALPAGRAGMGRWADFLIIRKDYPECGSKMENISIDCKKLLFPTGVIPGIDLLVLFEVKK